MAERQSSIADESNQASEASTPTIGRLLQRPLRSGAGNCAVGGDDAPTPRTFIRLNTSQIIDDHAEVVASLESDGSPRRTDLGNERIVLSKTSLEGVGSLELESIIRGLQFFGRADRGRIVPELAELVLDAPARDGAC